MKSGSFEQKPFRRFVEGADGDPLDDRIGACFRHVVDATGLPAARVEAIGRRLAERGQPRRMRAVSKPILWAILTIALVLAWAGCGPDERSDGTGAAAGGAGQATPIDPILDPGPYSYGSTMNVTLAPQQIFVWEFSGPVMTDSGDVSN